MKIRDLKLGQKVLIGGIVPATYKGINKVKTKFGKTDRYVFQNDNDFRDRKLYLLEEGDKTLKSEKIELA